MNAKWISIIGSGVMIVTAHGQLSLEYLYRGTGAEFLKVFETQREVLQQSSALIQDGRDESGYGVIISADGSILTKASEYQALKKPVVIIGRERYDEVVLCATDPEWDVALIKVKAADLVPVTWAATSAVPLGSWVLANGASSTFRRRLMAGVVSAKIHEIPAADGVAIGVELKTDAKELVVGNVYPGGGAADAGMKKDDRILEVAGKALKTIKELAETLKPYRAGSRVPFKIQRGKETLELQVRVDPKKDLFANKLENQPQDRNDQMSGDFSNRRSGFPRVLQHSILGSSKIVGGPLLDLEGHCLGMNIARANRAESFAIPVEDVKEIAGRLLAEAAKNPAVVAPAPEQ